MTLSPRLGALRVESSALPQASRTSCRYANRAPAQRPWLFRSSKPAQAGVEPRPSALPGATPAARQSRFRGVSGMAVLAVVLCLAGCDPKRISELEEGVSTEADVRTRFGEPEAIWD